LRNENKKTKKTSLGPSQPPQLAHLTIPNLITYKRQPPAMSSSVAPSCPSSQPPPDMRCHQQDQTVGWTWLLAPNLHLLLPGSSSRSPPRRPRAATAGSPPHRRHPFLFLSPSPSPYDGFQGDGTPYLCRALYHLGDALKTMVLVSICA
jgi:hypothetical protein